MAGQETFRTTWRTLARIPTFFWQRQIDAAEQETIDYRHPPLPLARIKKVMKSDPDVKMIAADAPILFCKACETDIAKAVSKSDQFDFLIDILPREEPLAAAGAGKLNSMLHPSAHNDSRVLR
ncbi:hypothetical protein BC629DRAFT_1584857 [Irpex lacteus]|nr:hypothetical protein BC629DRAFT_1584857 [Irpex lacteus]